MAEPSLQSLQAENERLKRAVAELSVLNEAAAAIGRADDLEAAVQALVRRALDAVDAEEGVIVLVGAPLKDTDATPPTFIRSIATVAERPAWHPDVSLLGWVQREQRPLVLNDPSGDARFARTTWPDHLRNVASVPMFARGRLSGVFTHYNKRGPEGFSDADVRLLAILAGQSAQAVERMRLAEEQERALRLFGQHTAPQVVEALMAGGGEVPVRRQEVTVMFLDLRGFTTLSEAWDPEQVVGYLNRLFDLAISVIVAHGGVVHQLLGDGLMALFGVPEPDPEAPHRAVAASLEILKAVEQACASGDLEPTRLGIGLNTGVGVVGPVGSKDHREYKVTGDVVNVTARIEGLCKTYDARLLVSRAVYGRLGSNPPPAKALGEVALRGRHAPVELFKLA